MKSYIRVHHIENVIGFDLSITLMDNTGNIIRPGSKTIKAPIPSSVAMITHTHVAALEFFTNYNENLVRKIREHKINSGSGL